MASKKPAIKAEPEAVAAPPPDTHFPIIGIGASAGGLGAYEVFFRTCPVDTGMAFVLVPHLDPGHESLLCEILQRTTAIRRRSTSRETLVCSMIGFSSESEQGVRVWGPGLLQGTGRVGSARADARQPARDALHRVGAAGMHWRGSSTGPRQT